ncbi:type II secretion system F family protein [Microvirga tunisiensis]|uniref:Type II secretion system F family protein n=2 Tax=Pannonibacter tanglangensis TaxID=2750084 RepID=A0A7X5F3S4_9HYPH|nr:MULTISPECIES: type II secretion system F family protein [unclassified Pannonibacter]NBN64656.1 type II secretion system F family protein [Pannonibacter sp. XCT-34]NBN79191.1 type II secretion system F family protein [Pannonibacter sp. XCT-53]
MDFAALSDSQLAIAALTLVAVAGTLFTLVMPMFERDGLKARMKSVALEREKLRARERARMATEKGQDSRTALRNQPKQHVKSVVDRLNLKTALADEKTQDKLRMAGFRGVGPLYTFLFARVVAPIVLFAFALFYSFAIMPADMPGITKVSIALFVGGIGVFAPNIYLQNLIAKRQQSIRRAWPDALDLMLICVESGMSIEVAFRKVADEIGIQSVPLAEELTLTNAELSYLQERRQAYLNFAKRTGVDSVKNVTMALVQAERYGTPIGHALRVMSDDIREQRMQEAEKKAAALPPKLTVPMILFFLPVIFCIVLGPAAIKVMAAM